jgi:hypothetical protein
METIQHKLGRFRAFMSQIAQLSKMLAISNCLVGPKPPVSQTVERSENIRNKAGRFRVLIIGRANAGKTTILKKVCNTTERPEIFDSKGNKVRSRFATHQANDVLMTYWRPDRRLSRNAHYTGMIPHLIVYDELTSYQRGLHNIENELVFQSNLGFIFHDSRGFEAGGKSELNTAKEFIAGRSKMGELSDQLHVIW